MTATLFAATMSEILGTHKDLPTNALQNGRCRNAWLRLTAHCSSRSTPSRCGCGTPSAVVRPDGTLLSYQPYGTEGVLVVDIDIAAATRVLATRYKRM